MCGWLVRCMIDVDKDDGHMWCGHQGVINQTPTRWSITYKEQGYRSVGA